MLRARTAVNKYHSTSTVSSQTTVQTAAIEPTIVVQGDELPSAYGAPGAFSRSRFSTLTNAYVLPPWGVYRGFDLRG